MNEGLGELRVSQTLFYAEVQFCKNKRQFGTFLTKNKTKGEKHMRNKKVLFLTQAAVIAAIYVVLTIFISAFKRFFHTVVASS